MKSSKKFKLIPFILFAFLYSCNSSTENNPVSEIKSATDSKLIESNSERNTSYKIFMNDSTVKSSGFGYDILMNGERYIHQSTIPAVSGNQYFKTEGEAKTIASFVCYKIQNNILPPTITLHELDSLGIMIK